MKDVFTVKRSADGDDVLKQLNGQFRKVITVTSSTYSVEDTDSGALYVLNLAAGIAITLPEPSPGLEFEFVIQTTFSGTFSITAKNAEDLFAGQLVMGFKGGQDESVIAVPDLSNDDALVADSNVKGRLFGGIIKCTCVSGNNSSAAISWVWSGSLNTDTGTVTSPFA